MLFLFTRSAILIVSLCEPWPPEKRDAEGRLAVKVQALHETSGGPALRFRRAAIPSPGATPMTPARTALEAARECAEFARRAYFVETYRSDCEDAVIGKVAALILEREAAAYRRGAEKMQEMAAYTIPDSLKHIADGIRSLPVEGE